LQATWKLEILASERGVVVFDGTVTRMLLPRDLGFAEEGRRVKHIRRANGELWDLIEMGLLL
jgi:adenylylsulfate kinase-like enzyme